MRARGFLLGFIAGIVLLFFYPLFDGKVPFPGDLLVGHFAPYLSNVYDGYPQEEGGVPHKAQGSDVVRQLYPWKYLAISLMREGQLPLWNPYNFSGNPLLANFQSGVFYPFNVLFFVLPFTSAWTVYIVAIPFLASVFLYFFLQELKLSKQASVFGGLVFAFSSYMVVWLEWGNVGHSILWLPLALFSLEKLRHGFKSRFFLLLLLSLVCSFFAGYVQGFFYVMLVLVVYTLGTGFSDSSYRKIRFPLTIAFFLAIGIAAVQLVPTLELFTLSSRSNYTLEQIDKLLNPLWYTVTVIIPNFFGNPAARNHWFYGTYIERVSYFGLIPLMFALLALTQWKKIVLIRIFGVVFFLAFFLSFDIGFVKMLYLLPLPLLSTTVPTRILSLFVFSGSILAAYGLDNFLHGEKKKPIIIVSLCGAVVFFGLWLFVLFSQQFITNQEIATAIQTTSRRNLILPTVLLLVFFSVVCAKIFLEQILSVLKKVFHASIKKHHLIFSIFFIVFVVTVGDLFYFFHRITPFSPVSFVFPKTPVVEFLQKQKKLYRMWGYGSGYVETNFQTYEKLFSPDGYDPLHIKYYGRLVESSKYGKLPKVIPRSDANIVGGSGTDPIVLNPFRQRLLDITGVAYVLHKIGEDRSALPDEIIFPPKIYNLLWHKGSWQVYENRQVVPRAMLVGSYLVEKDAAKQIAKLYDPRFDPRKTIVLEESIPGKYVLREDRHSKATISSYKANQVTIETQAKEDMLLFLSDAWYPGWKVTVDGKQEKLYRANTAFRAVAVKKGDHRIIFSYQPLSVRIGSIISIGSLFLGALVVLVTKRAVH